MSIVTDNLKSVKCLVDRIGRACYDIGMNQFISRAFAESGLTQTEIAGRMGVTKQAVYNLLATPAPRPETVIRFLRALGWHTAAIEALLFVEVYGSAALFTDSVE